MEKKIERIHSQRKQKASQTAYYTLLGMKVDRITSGASFSSGMTILSILALTKPSSQTSRETSKSGVSLLLMYINISWMSMRLKVMRKRFVKE